MRNETNRCGFIPLVTISNFQWPNVNLLLSFNIHRWMAMWKSDPDSISSRQWTTYHFHWCLLVTSAHVLFYVMFKCKFGRESLLQRSQAFSQDEGMENAIYRCQEQMLWIKKTCDIVLTMTKKKWISVLKWHYCYLRVHLVHWCSQL